MEHLETSEMISKRSGDQGDISIDYDALGLQETHDTSQFLSD